MDCGRNGLLNSYGIPNGNAASDNTLSPGRQINRCRLPDTTLLICDDNRFHLILRLVSVWIICRQTFCRRSSK